VPNSDSAILAGIVRSIKNQEFDPLTALIDEYLIKRNLPKYLKKRLTTVEFPMLDRPRPGGRLSPSSICGCERQAAFKFLGIQGDFRLDPDQELLFEDGKWRHLKWGYIFRDMELVLGRKRFRVISIEEPVKIGALYVAGSLDAVVDVRYKGDWIRYVVDFKGSNNFSFEKAYRDRAPHPTYKKQLITYIRAKNAQKNGPRITRGMLLYDSKDKNKFYVFVIKFTDEDWAEVKLWCKNVIKQIEDQQIPPRHPDCNQGQFMFGKCQFRKLCFGKKGPKQLQREVFVDFPGIKKLWDDGHKEIESHSGYEGD